jgi:hypothetical protein
MDCFIFLRENVFSGLNEIGIHVVLKWLEWQAEVYFVVDKD